MKFTTPPADTVATDGSLLVHVTALLVAFSGAMVAVNVSGLSPTVLVSVVLFNVTLVTGIAAACTVTAQVAVFPPSCVVTVIVDFPSPMKFTTPPADTVATDGSLLVQVTVLLVAFAGATVAVSVSAASPTVFLRLLLFSVTPVTGIVWKFATRFLSPLTVNV
jgi:predicted secreted protein